MAQTTLVSARVDTAVLEQAKRMLAAAGSSVSEVIRHTFETMVRTGEVPREEEDWYDAEKAKKIEESIAFIESLPVGDPIPGWGDVEVDKQILGEWRMERFGEGL